MNHCHIKSRRSIGLRGPEISLHLPYSYFSKKYAKNYHTITIKHRTVFNAHRLIRQKLRYISIPVTRYKRDLGYN